MPLSPRTLQRRQSLQEQAYQAIRAAILSGELTPGQRLVETHLAEKLQVSRTPIREAFRQLQNEDLVTLDSSNVLRVATFSVADAIQLYDCRIALEALSVAEACSQATNSQLAQLLEIVEQSEKLTVSKPSQLTNFQLLDIDYRFHRFLAECSGNLWLRSLLDQVFDKMALLRIQTVQKNRAVLEVRFEHRQVYEQLVMRDRSATVQAITDHLIAAKNRVADEMQNAELGEKPPTDQTVTGT
ncbi:MAG: GntR family transcriptional regulator [Thermosynechococcaceae cyanobacterium]